jgi:hypothetical protein
MRQASDESPLRDSPPQHSRSNRRIIWISRATSQLAAQGGRLVRCGKIPLTIAA